MHRIRDFRNGDIPALAGLWNRGLSVRSAARPLEPHELDAVLFSRIDFRAQAFKVAEADDGRLLGFAHAGLGAAEPRGPSHQLDHTMGTLAMLVVDPSVQDLAVGSSLAAAAESELRSMGVSVFYAGGMHPLNPFYWGIYGGSEFSGILDDHLDFRRVVESAGYQPVAATQMFEYPLERLPNSLPDPRVILVRRQSDLVTDEDALLESWWDALALGTARPSTHRLIRRDGLELARATTWEMAGFERLDGQLRAGILDVGVPSELRRKGYAKCMLFLILRHLKDLGIQVASVQTSTSNAAALALYESLGFEPSGSSTLYRRPAQS